MNTLKNAGSGYKTYVSGFGMIIFAIYGLITGTLSLEIALPILLNGLGLIGIKHALSKAK